jgi:hypothetical protein
MGKRPERFTRHSRKGGRRIIIIKMFRDEIKNATSANLRNKVIVCIQCRLYFRHGSA